MHPPARLIIIIAGLLGASVAVSWLIPPKDGGVSPTKPAAGAV